MPSNPPPPSILHVGSSLSTMDGGLDAGLAAALAESFELCHCNDVYLAIVRLMRPATEPTDAPDLPAAVFVSLDTLEHAELEFFGIVARFLPDLPVLVYGRNDIAGLLEQALDRGATGRATEESIRDLASRLVPPAAAVPADEIPSDEEDERWPPTPASDAAIARDESQTSTMDEDEGRIENEVESDIEGENEVEDVGDVPAGPVRVPWLRYADVPARSAPPTPPQPEHLDSSIPSSVGEDPDRLAQHTPLLTEEELQALIGPDERDHDETDQHEHRNEDEIGDRRELDR